MLFIKNMKMNAFPNKMSQDCYFDNTKGFWGTVTKVHSENNTVDLVSVYGNEYKNINVATHGWVLSQARIGDRNLPPVGSNVFVFLPDGIIETGFVLCSGYFRGEEKDNFLCADDEDSKAIKDAQREIYTPGGWHFTEDYIGGSVELSKEDKVAITFNNDPDKESLSIKALDLSVDLTTEENKEKCEIKVFENTITFNAKSDDKYIQLEANGAKIKIDKDGNILIDTTKDTKVKTDKITIETSSYKVTNSAGITALEVTP